MGNRVVKQFSMWGAAMGIVVCTAACLSVTLVSPTDAQVAVASSTTSSAVEPRVSVDMQNVVLKVALQHIAQQAGLTPFYSDVVTNITTPVTLRVSDIPVAEAFARVLRGTGLKAVINARRVSFGTSDAGERTVNGVITGKVVDDETHQPLPGVKVTIDGSTTEIVTTSDGTFGITDVSVGSHTIAFRRIGYARVSRTVTVTDARPVTMEVSLGRSASTLDQVVVTGTVVATQLKAIPSAITVITAKQIEERGITKIDQLFRGDVPGLFAQNQGSNAPLDEVRMFSRGASALSGSSAGTAYNTNPIKTYVDGVELADPKYLSQIDPKSIERIEILTGPQASTIYGSNALNGVMQVFTKRGTSTTPQFTLNLLNGWVENNFSAARTPEHDYSAQLNGIEGRLSYNAGEVWNYMGPWTPAMQSTRTDGFGGARLELPTPVGRVTTDFTLRRSLTQSVQRGATDQELTKYRETGWLRNLSTPPGFAPPTTATLTGQTLGVTLTYMPTLWWSHEVGMGMDASDTETRRTARGQGSPSDTNFSLAQSHAGRRSLRYTTTTQIPLTSVAHATVTAGADGWQSLATTFSMLPQTLTGTLTSAFTPRITRTPDHNTGGFLQAQLAVHDRLFLTYGVRAEWNPGFGADQQPNYAPRYGIAYTYDMGALSAKLRASYGRSTRPPLSNYKGEVPVTDPNTIAYYGNIAFQLANPDLGPEYQQGGEGGLELYLGTRASLVITRYNQTVDQLIDFITADSVRSIGVCPTSLCFSNSLLDAAGYGYQYQYQHVNVGSLRNQGWEFQGSVNTGPFTTRGTYSWTKSRTIGVNPKYRALFATNAQYQPGATFGYLPEHTWALGVTYAQAATTLGLNVTGIGRVTLPGASDEFSIRNLLPGVRLPQNRLNVSTTGYVNANPGYAMADLTASHRFSTSIEGVLQIKNLTDHYTSDWEGGDAVLGRQSQIGVRIRW